MRRGGRWEKSAVPGEAAAIQRKPTARAQPLPLMYSLLISFALSSERETAVEREGESAREQEFVIWCF